MQTIRIPRQLPDSATLQQWNRQLRQGEASLDWSAVESVDIQPASLHPLLDGLSLDEDFERLGIETIAEFLQPIITQTFDEQNSATTRSNHRAHTLTPAEPAPFADTMPDLWLPEEAESTTAAPQQVEDEEEEDDMSRTMIRPVVKKQIDTKTGPILAAPSDYELRRELEEMVVRDLLGPAGGPEEEVTDSRVRDRYLVGMLAPNDAATPAEELDSSGTIEEGIEDQGQVDTDASQTTSLSPAAMGMSFCVDTQATQLQVTARWGQYLRGKSEQGFTKKDGNVQTVWRRVQRGGQPYILALREGPIEPWQPEPGEQPEIYVKGLIRQSKECWTVTLFLVNQQTPLKQLRDAAWIFQTELSVEAPGGGPIFQRRPAELQQMYRNDDKILAMQYRKHISFAIGHGTSVHAETLPNDPTSAVRLTTSAIPRYEVPRTEAPGASDIPTLASLCLDMDMLATSSGTELASRLTPLATAYEEWITEQERRLNDPEEDLSGFRETAGKTLHNCRATLTRIREGIALVSSNEQAMQAFIFMNRAMAFQRIRTQYTEEVRRGGKRSLHDFNIPVNRSWRPFQLAFILLNIPALTDLNHPERSDSSEALADLLWFPTGGGKTEAYLGLTAYTLGIRRLQGVVAGRSGLDGVAVIMRYTLRLLTLQQFQRAAALICACEIIRRTAPDTWGSTPFRLGLWVGQNSTPNTTAQCDEAVTELRSKGDRFSGGHGNPRQLTHCPWCGEEIRATHDIRVETLQKGVGRTFTYCGSRTCPFSQKLAPTEGLPVLVVDEEIYRLLPALLIATVDKFAQLPWRGETQMLFGQVDKYCERHGFRSPEIEDKDSHKALGAYGPARSIECGPLRPPDLIIQDELHLISGPLGTMVGLYETAVDALSTWEVNGQMVRPKVIAATATIRQAEDQTKALFRRQLNIFPPQGIDIEDNFFARQVQPSPEKPGRLYLGICANGRRMKATEIRVYIAYLAAAQALKEKYGYDATDPWQTLVGYFNSMSELGGMRHLVDDDISSRLRNMDKRGLARRSFLKVRELTSRVSSADIPTTLSELEQNFTDEKKGIDVLLATNMISVGVDVRRLSLMVIAGQPKTTAEYIQATSRVGRTFPGLVCSIYNWARPRDLSHYEQFEHYHATFYQQVEALSVTPFAPRALDRGLAALLTSIVRLGSDRYNLNSAAGLVEDSSIPEFEQAIASIARRVEEIEQLEDSIRVREELAKLIDYWTGQASKYPHFGYKKSSGKMINLLKEPTRGQWEPFTCQYSLRNVEPAVHLILEERPQREQDIEIEEDEQALVEKD